MVRKFGYWLSASVIAFTACSSQSGASAGSGPTIGPSPSLSQPATGPLSTATPAISTSPTSGGFCPQASAALADLDQFTNQTTFDPQVVQKLQGVIQSLTTLAGLAPSGIGAAAQQVAHDIATLVGLAQADPSGTSLSTQSQARAAAEDYVMSSTSLRQTVSQDCPG